MKHHTTKFDKHHKATDGSHSNAKLRSAMRGGHQKMKFNKHHKENLLKLLELLWIFDMGTQGTVKHSVSPQNHSKKQTSL